METSTFLTPAEVAELTGIKIGKRIGGHLISRNQRQVEWLRVSGIPFIENAIGRPIITRAVIEGRNAPPPKEQKPTWQPRAFSGGK